MRRTVAVLIVVAVFGVGCSSKSGTPSSSTRTPGETSTAAASGHGCDKLTADEVTAVIGTAATVSSAQSACLFQVGTIGAVSFTVQQTGNSASAKAVLDAAKQPGSVSVSLGDAALWTSDTGSLVAVKGGAVVVLAVAIPKETNDRKLEYAKALVEKILSKL